MNRIYQVIIATGVLLATGCTTFETQAFDPASNANLTEIVYITPALPEDPGVTVLAPVGANFGLIGAIAVEAGLSAKRKKLNASLASVSNDEYEYHVEFNDAVSSNLSSLGYVVVPKTVARPDGKLEFLEDYSDIETSGGILDLYVSFFGYAAAGSGTEFRPTLQLNARLTRPSGEILYADQVFYNGLGNTADAILIDADPKFSFEKFDTIEEEPALAKEGLSAAIAAVAAELAKQLQR